MNTDKIFNVRLPRDLWLFFRKKALDEDTTMNTLIIKYVEKLKRKCDKKELTDDDSKV